MKLFTPESSAGTSHADKIMRNPGTGARARSAAGPVFGIWRAYHCNPGPPFAAGSTPLAA
jgi:hypothetical protein